MPVSTSCPAPCVTVVAVETACAMVATFCLTAVADGLSEGDVMTGAGVATVGAMEMTEGVFDIIWPRAPPTAERYREGVT